MVKNEEIIVQSEKGSKKIGSGRWAFFLDMESKLVEFKRIRSRGLKMYLVFVSEVRTIKIATT